VAIGLVLVYHFTLGMQGEGIADRLLFKVTSIGWCGVDLFFVLSGFMITGILSDARESPRRFRNFYARRALRIFPLYYAALLIGTVAVSAAGAGSELEETRLWLWGYGTNILVALRDAWFPLSHFWSLAIEEHFYLFWPAIIFWCDRKTAMRVCGVMIIAAWCVRLWMVSAGAVLAAYCLTVCRIDALAVGGLVALAARRAGGLESMVSHRKKIVLGGAFALLALCVWRRGFLLYDPAIQIAGYSLLDLLFAAVLVTAVAPSEGSRFAQTLALRPLQWLGRYSYGLYVYNSIFLMVAEKTSLMARLVGWSGSTTVGRLLYVGVLAFSTLATAWVSWHVLEKRFLKLKHYFPMTAAAGYSGVASPHGDEIQAPTAWSRGANQGAGRLTRHLAAGMNGIPSVPVR
jgi:peptidoglycan/LPS O-acetylase OafA/YrhL